MDGYGRPEAQNDSRHLTQETHMNAIDTKRARAVRRLAVIVLVGALALSFAAIATLGVETDVTGDGAFAWVGEYMAKVAEALGGG